MTMTDESKGMWAELAAPLRAFVARRVPPGIEADDVIQDVFLRVVRHLPSLRDSDRLDAWLYQIARNSLYDSMRARQRRDLRHEVLEIDVAAVGGAEEERRATAELAPCLTPMIARLDPPYREAIELTSRGLTQSEAATRAGISISGMKSRVQRAREQLKQMLLQCCEVDIDRRGGVADYQLRDATHCGTPGEHSGRVSRCGHGSCSRGY